jgi:dipeptidyl aminopeptidase/acylaminoacyl peptidase
MLSKAAWKLLALILATIPASLAWAASNPQGGFSLQQALSYPFPSSLTAAPTGDAVAWAADEQGVRNVWMVAGPGSQARELTHYTEDDGQEISNLAFSADGTYLVYVRGGDHDANWPDGLQPDPDASTTKPEVQVWSINLEDGTQKLLGDGDEPEVAPDSRRVAFIHLPERSVWWAPLDGSAKADRLFFDRGRAEGLRWSPDGKALAFVSGRDDHSFIGIYRDGKTAVQYLAPSTSLDFMPRWSPDGKALAFVRLPGTGGAPEPFLKQVPHPWSLWVSDVLADSAVRVWQSPATLRGSYPETEGEANLHWLAGDQLLFLADMDNWPHLYAVPAQGGEARLLTPGKFMVEDVRVTQDGTRIIYTANTGATQGDQDRRHIYLLDAQGGKPETIITAGEGIEWTPAIPGDGKMLAFVRAGSGTPPLVMYGSLAAQDWQALDADRVPADFPAAAFVTPKPVHFTAADGMEVHGQLFARDDGSPKKPAIIFVHGGPPRQMLLGWHYMHYYSNAYAVNQYLANHGFVVLSVNYRLGIGYGHDYHHPDHWGPTGAAEYKDVLAGAKYLSLQPSVDAKRIGIWGGSYGGYLTALALARNSNIFKAGVDFHGVHDWSYDLAEWSSADKPRYEEGDHKQAMKTAWLSSPDSAIATWRSPVLLIQGDDDRNVHFHEMVDLVNRLQKQNVPYEQLVIPDEIHGFLRQASWYTADSATVEFLQRKFQPQAQ